MDQGTEDDTAIRVTRDDVSALRTALTAIGIPHDVARDIVPTADVTGRPLIRMGTWPPAAVAALTAALTARPPLIGRPDAPPQLPLRS